MIRRRLPLLLGTLALSMSGWAIDTPQPAPPAAAQPATSTSGAPTPTSPTGVKKGAKPKPSRYQPDRFAGRAAKYYGLTWGVDSLSVKLVESGELVRFTYRVLDADRAKILNDKQVEALLVDPKAGVSLVVPTMEKVGQLRQGAPPEAGRSYWMTFSNKGGRVARGDRVNVVVGAFRANFLVVD